MAFLEKADLYILILEDELEEITRGDDTIINAAISSAVSEARTHLFDSYDVDEIFGATGSSRHALMVNLVSDIALYFIVGRSQAGQDVDDRKARYDRAIKTLTAMKKSETYSDLPRREETEQTHIIYGSNTKRSNHY